MLNFLTMALHATSFGEVQKKDYAWFRLTLSDQWTGAIGLIERDGADYAIDGRGFGWTYARSKVVSFPPGFSFQPIFWLTRTPRHQSPIWNLTRLFTKGVP